MHHGIGLDRFNSLSRLRAIHALYACCCNVTWAQKIADGRPYPGHAALLTAAAAELHALSAVDLERVFDSCARERVSEHTVEGVNPLVRARLLELLGPEEGYPEY
ncbi:2-oxo-4-hydroxy-4-carboxy-5-ureidoimidazoline decarboxylase [Nocardia sp. CDC160]|uniref:2-oxo-4-hydroxy-4-carboxy-5-ureidoimidazoline decarboxylase n=1 Tax=Nocardia sp. CDC160 TaxID=3112166 RepID=UPI002DBDA29A|nr:2-oxo-4-hydroxy-4-carboxy-5-ureidoimidazoline decarboxylase [Nocardia sp. CDC160]MEC3913785.1 2-oxo-4-hydroxy-4-carboxy-5-ureidoimidazoline decarboxylase [Nocardia sp. CDC160]